MDKLLKEKENKLLDSGGDMSKKTVAIIGSRSIVSLNLDIYINERNIKQVISGGAKGIDCLAEKWARQHGIEVLIYKPQYEVYGGRYAPIQRDKDLVAASDIVIAFWDGKSKGTKFTIDYARELGVPTVVHLIEER